MNSILILLAAGDSARLKSRIPKPFNFINNKTLLEHAFYAFESFKEIKKIVVVYNKKHKRYLNALNLKNSIKIIGGKTRQESTFKALKYIKKFKCKKVLIHDDARPSPSKNLIKNILEKLKNNHAVIPVINTYDAAKRIKNNLIFKNIQRKTLRFSQTPQGFTFNKIYKKHVKNVDTKFDDDCSFFIRDNENVVSIPGNRLNFKITDQEDLNMFSLLKKRKIYFGIGFDIHRLVPKRKLYLGGIKIPSSIGTLGHSDGDPVLHSLIDGILGACRLGDIGKIFSDKNKKYKNIESTLLLKKIINLIESKGFLINNIDINIIAQKPKVKRYSNKMINVISKICKINSNHINIKGKTTEKLGLIGKKKAIAAETIVSVSYND